MREELLEYYNSYEIDVVSYSNGTTKVTSPKKINEAINNIAKFNFIDDEIKYLKENIDALYFNREEVITVNSESARKYADVIAKIETKTLTVIRAISVAIKDQEENMISIKLPPYMDLKRVAKFITDVENMVKTVLPSDKPSKVVLNNFDTGSNWIEIAMSTMENVVLIGDFINVTSEFVKMFLLDNLKTRKEIENSTTIEEKAKEIMLKGMESLVDEKAKLCVMELLQNGTINVDDIPKIEEYKSGLQVQIVKTANYLIDGAEYRPALNAPKEIVEQFPSVEEFKKIQSEAPSIFIEHIENEEDHIEGKSLDVNDGQVEDNEQED